MPFARGLLWSTTESSLIGGFLRKIKSEVLSLLTAMLLNIQSNNLTSIKTFSSRYHNAKRTGDAGRKVVVTRTKKKKKKKKEKERKKIEEKNEEKNHLHMYMQKKKIRRNKMQKYTV